MASLHIGSMQIFIHTLLWHPCWCMVSISVSTHFILLSCIIGNKFQLVLIHHWRCRHLPWCPLQNLIYMRLGWTLAWCELAIKNQFEPYLVWNCRKMICRFMWFCCIAVLMHTFPISPLRLFMGIILVAKWVKSVEIYLALPKLTKLSVATVDEEDRERRKLTHISL